MIYECTCCGEITWFWLCEMVSSTFNQVNYLIDTFIAIILDNWEQIAQFNFNAKIIRYNIRIIKYFYFNKFFTTLFWSTASHVTDLWKRCFKRIQFSKEENNVQYKKIASVFRWSCRCFDYRLVRSFVKAHKTECN